MENDSKKFWKVLIVDDQNNVHTMIKVFLRNFEYENCGLQIIDAFSEEEAIEIMERENDIILIFLDMFMEDENSGFKVINYVREVLNNHLTRIVIITDYNEKFSEEKVIRDYDVDEYKNKSILNREKLSSIIITCIRSYKRLHKINNQLQEIEKVRNELEALNQELENKVNERTIELQEKNKILEERDRVMTIELSLAQSIQYNFINKHPPENNLCSFYTLYKPMGKIGGDFYDFIVRREGDFGVFIGDVSGHGIPAALITSMLKIFNSFNRKYSNNPPKFLQELNNALVGIIAGNFITAFYGILSLDKAFTFCNAGHCSPFLFKKSNNEVYELKSEGVILGIKKDIRVFKTYQVQLEKGDRIILYTDGLTEMMNGDSGYGKKIVYNFIKDNIKLELNALINNLYKEFLNQKELSKTSFEDDVTIVGLEIK